MKYFVRVWALIRRRFKLCIYIVYFDSLPAGPPPIVNSIQPRRNKKEKKNMFFDIFISIVNELVNIWHTKVTQPYAKWYCFNHFVNGSLFGCVNKTLRDKINCYFNIELT